MLKMRLQRIGKPGHAYFRLAVLEHTTKAQGKYLELLGSYDPHKKQLQAKKERIRYWMSKGVQLTPSVNNLLITHNVIQGEKVKAWKPKINKAAPAA
ncbi:MAG: 30S ribosomal protein S16 [Patescibacteria group bacterium]